MKTVIILAAMLLSMTSTAQIGATRIKRQLETSNPAEFQLNLRWGETVDFDLQFLSHGTAMDVTGATVTLHAVTNGMPTGTSFQMAGTAGSSGTVSFRIVVDEWLPYGLTSGTWTIECDQVSDGRIMRASGVLKCSGIYYPSATSPLPVTWATNIWTAISGIQSKTNDWNAAFGWGDHALQGYLAAESDPGISVHNTNETAHASLLAGKVSVTDTVYTDTVARASSALQAESDPLVAGHIKAITEGQIANWNSSTGAVESAKVESVFGRTGAVVAVTGDYTAEQVGAYPVNNPSNYVQDSFVFGVAYTASNQTFTGVNTFSSNVVIQAGTTGNANAPLVIKQLLAYGSPYTQTLLTLLGNTGSTLGTFTADGRWTAPIFYASSYFQSVQGSQTTPVFSLNTGVTGIYFPTTESVGITVSRTNRLNISTTAITATLPTVITNTALTPSLFVYGGGTNASQAALTVQTQTPYAAPYTGTIQNWLKSDGTSIASIRSDGRFSVGNINLQGSLLCSVGTAASPPVSINSAGAGLWFPTVNTVGISSFSTNRLTVGTTIISTVPVHAPSFVFTNFAAGSYLFSNGTNLFFVNVNAVTNQLTSN